MRSGQIIRAVSIARGRRIIQPRNRPGFCADIITLKLTRAQFGTRGSTSLPRIEFPSLGCCQIHPCGSRGRSPHQSVFHPCESVANVFVPLGIQFGTRGSTSLPRIEFPWLGCCQIHPRGSTLRLEIRHLTLCPHPQPLSHPTRRAGAGAAGGRGWRRTLRLRPSSDFGVAGRVSAGKES
jgi:hypothetical protein